MAHNSLHHEQHKSHRNGWLRAGVLGANDGIVSTASLIIGVARQMPHRPTFCWPVWQVWWLVPCLWLRVSMSLLAHRPIPSALI